MAIEELDFTNPIKHSNLVDAIVKKIAPNTAQNFKWYLNLFPREERSEDRDYKEAAVIKIGYKDAKKFRDNRGAMLRKINGKI